MGPDELGSREVLQKSPVGKLVKPIALLCGPSVSKHPCSSTTEFDEFASCLLRLVTIFDLVRAQIVRGLIYQPLLSNTALQRRIGVDPVREMSHRRPYTCFDRQAHFDAT